MTNHKKFNVRFDEMKPAVVQKRILIQQYEFIIVSKYGIKIPHLNALSHCKPSEYKRGYRTSNKQQSLNWLT